MTDGTATKPVPKDGFEGSARSIRLTALGQFAASSMTAFRCCYQVGVCCSQVLGSVFHGLPPPVVVGRSWLFRA